MHVIQEDKVLIRERLKLQRAAIPEDVRSEKSRKITELLLDFLLEYDTVMVYVSKAPEVDTHPLIEQLLRRGTRIVVPIIERETFSLRLSYLTDLSCLSISTFNVPEPIGCEIPANPEDIQAAVIPVIGFDAEGNRLGYGAGYYDRFLERSPWITKIGVGFGIQQYQAIPANIFDVRLDYIVTENSVLSC